MGSFMIIVALATVQGPRKYFASVFQSPRILKTTLYLVSLRICLLFLSPSVSTLFFSLVKLRGNCGVFCVSSHILHTLSQVDRHARAVHHGVCAVAEGLRGHSHPRDREGGVHSPVAGVSHPLSLGVFVHNSPSLRSL